MRGWRPSPLALDAALALVLTILFAPGAIDGAEGPAWAVVPLVLAQTLPLAVRRARPIGVLAITLVAGIVFNLGFADSPTLPLGVVVSLYTVAAHRERPVAARAAVVTAATLPWALLAAGDLDVDAALLPLGATAGAWLLGDNVRTRRAYLGELETRAAAREQARIARELHDVISHSVSVMVVQATAGGEAFDAQPAQARAALASVEETGRQALVELRRLLGVIRTDEEPQRTPQPGLGRLPGLLEQMRAAGLPVQLTVTGRCRPLPPGLDLAAYRVVQEALTNTLKHAGASTATVNVSYDARELAVDVQDDGGAPVDGGLGGGGRGLAGMRERVALYGGDVRAGARSGGGFEVSARFPLDPGAPR